MARERRIGNQWPAWFYAPDGDAAIYQTQQDVPEGWHRKKFIPYGAPAALSIDKDDTIRQLQLLGVEINPCWGAAQLQKVLNDRSTSR